MKYRDFIVQIILYLKAMYLLFENCIDCLGIYRKYYSFKMKLAEYIQRV